jgi:hypothetical protein
MEKFDHGDINASAKDVLVAIDQFKASILILNFKMEEYGLEKDAAPFISSLISSCDSAKNTVEDMRTKLEIDSKKDIRQLRVLDGLDDSSEKH